MELNLPKYEFTFKQESKANYIFDELRKKYLLITPEEWVRQNIIKYLIQEKSFPKGLISIEAGISVNTLKRRYDILIYSRSKTPLVLVECKAPAVNISKKVFEQIIAYNSKIKAPYMFVTNGLSHFFLKRNMNMNFSFMENIPDYSDLI